MLRRNACVGRTIDDPRFESLRRSRAVLDRRLATRRAGSRDAKRAGQYPTCAGRQGSAERAELSRRSRARRPDAGAAGQLSARSHRPAGGRDDRSGKAADCRRRPARRARSRDRRHEARERNRRGAQCRSRGLLRRLPAQASCGADGRRRLSRRGGLSGRGREATPRGRRQADRHRQLSGRLADHDDGGGPAGTGRRDHARRNAALLLGRGSRQESDALSRRNHGRRVAGGAGGRHGRGDLRRREPGRQFRVPEPGEHLLDEALQRLFEGQFRDGTLPRIRNLVGQPGAAQRRRNAVDRRQPVRRQQALRRGDSHLRRCAHRPARHQVADRLLLLLGR